MDIQIGRYYQTRGGKTVKILAREQKPMRPLTNQFQADLDGWRVKPVDDDQARNLLIDCFRCWSPSEDDDGDDDNYYVTLSGQACFAYKLISGEDLRYAYPSETNHDEADLIREIHPNEAERHQFQEKSFELTHYIALSLRVQAPSSDLAYDQLPPESAVAKALRPLFTSSTVEMKEISYDYSQGEIEQEEDLSDNTTEREE